MEGTTTENISCPLILVGCDSVARKVLVQLFSPLKSRNGVPSRNHPQHCSCSPSCSPCRHSSHRAPSLCLSSQAQQQHTMTGHIPNRVKQAKTIRRTRQTHFPFVALLWIFQSSTVTGNYYKFEEKLKVGSFPYVCILQREGGRKREKTSPFGICSSLVSYFRSLD